MGLDMYLNRKIYIGNEYKKPEERLRTLPPKRQREAFPIPPIKDDDISEIVERAGYWRKANAIHRWFVENVQEGNDDCGYYHVSTEQLRELLRLVDEVLASYTLQDAVVTNGYTFSAEGVKEPIVEPGKIISDTTKAQELLPSTEGFFFGSTDYDQWYHEDLLATKKILEEAVADERGEYEYHSSW